MIHIIIAQYQGKSLISKLIRGQTRSLWSHTAAVLSDGSVIEAWHKGGVSHVKNLSVNHTPGTAVDLFRIKCTPEQAAGFEDHLLQIVGKKYDFRSVFRFLTKVPAIINDQWFCTEAVVDALNCNNLYPQCRICPAEMSPQLLGIAPIMLPWGQITTE